MKNNTHATQCYNIITVKIVYQILNIVSNLNAFSPNSYYMPCACVWELCHLCVWLQIFTRQMTTKVELHNIGKRCNMRFKY